MSRLKTILIQPVLLLCFFTAKAQNYFADYLSVGSSLTYMRFVEKDELDFESGYDEYTLNVNAGIHLTKNLFTGLQVLNVYSSDIIASKDHYLIYGLFTQYSLFDNETAKLFVETSLNRGDYCTAGNIPYSATNLYYWGLGGGLDLSFKKVRNLYLDLSFINYSILNDIDKKYSYTQYIVGLNYRFNAH